MGDNVAAALGDRLDFPMSDRNSLPHRAQERQYKPVGCLRA